MGSRDRPHKEVKKKPKDKGEWKRRMHPHNQPIIVVEA